MENKYDIVLVEDNLEDAELTIRALKKNQISEPLIHLKNGEEALNFLFCRGIYESRNSNFLPKLILLDIKMPKVNGLEVLLQIKSNNKTKQIPVVLFTSSKEEKDIIESYYLGANSYVVKPVDFASFMKVVAEISSYWLLINQQPISV